MRSIMVRSVALIAVLVVVATAQHDPTFFPMGVSLPATWNGMSFLPDAESLGANWAWFDCSQFNQDINLMTPWFQYADSCGIGLMLLNAGLEPGGLTIKQIASGQKWTYEAETLIVQGDIGQPANDTLASGGTAWLVTDTAGWFQTGGTRDYIDNMWLTGTTLPYFAYFCLRTDSAGLADSTPVCSLLVTETFRGRDTAFVAGQKLLRADFSRWDDIYDTFVLRFSKTATDTGVYRFSIYSFGNSDSLWSDWTAYFDTCADMLWNNNQPWAQIVQNIAQHYDPYLYPAVYRLYLADETDIDQLQSCGKVNGLIGQRGVNWCFRLLDEYVQAVHPAELMVDRYPFMGRTYPSDGVNPPPGGSQRTPLDAGSVFQGRLDTFCLLMSDARRVSQAANPPLSFWVTTQGFGEFITDSQHHYKSEWDSLCGPSDTARLDEGIWREPTPREMRCLGWLALAYGARGLDYTQFVAGFGQWLSKNYCIPGFLKWDAVNGYPLTGQYRPLFDTLREFIINTLQRVAPTLLSLHSDAVGKWNGTGIGFVSGCSDSLAHVGTFAGPGGQYFIVVNRHCLPSDSMSDTLTLHLEPGDYPHDWFLHDEVSGEAIASSAHLSGDMFEFPVRLDPGQGRLFRVVPFTGLTCANQDEKYANMMPVVIQSQSIPGPGFSIDSMRITCHFSPSAQDSLTASAESTGWLGYRSGYVWWARLEGWHRFSVRYMLTDGIVTPEYWTASVVIDSVAPHDSMNLNHNLTVTAVPQCTVCSYAQDNSEMYQMQFTANTMYPLELVNDPGLTNPSLWPRRNCVIVESLQMARLSVFQGCSSNICQFIPSSQLSGYVGQQMMVEADIVSDSFFGEAWLGVRYLYVQTCTTFGVDTLSDWNPVMPIETGFVAHVGTYNYAGSFTFLPNPPENLYFAGIKIGIFTPMQTGACGGTLWCDNIRLDVQFSGQTGNPIDWIAYQSEYYPWNLGVSHVSVTKARYRDIAGNEGSWVSDGILYEPHYPPVETLMIAPGSPGPMKIVRTIETDLYAHVVDSLMGEPDSMQVTQVFFAPWSINMTATDSFTMAGYQQSQVWYLNHGDGKYVLNVRFLTKGDSVWSDKTLDLSDSCILAVSAPSPIAPVDGAQNRPLNASLIWHSSAWQPNYDVYLGADSASLTRVDSNLTDTTYACSGLTSYQKCYWRVVARYLGSEDSSEIRSFRTLITADRPLTLSSGCAARRLARNLADSSIAAVSELVLGNDTVIAYKFDCEGSDSTWYSVADGSLPELAFSDATPWLVYLGDHDSDLVVGCMRPDSSWKTYTVLSGSPGLKLGPPTLALFQEVSGRVAQIAVPAYDTAGSSMILFIQADTSECVLDTAHYATGSFADSSCHIEASVTDSIRLVFASGDIFYRELNYEPTAASTPDTWSKLSLVSDTLGLAGQPFCEQVGNRLYVTFRQIDNPVSGPLYSIQRASCDLSTAARVWEGLGPVSAVDSVLKANPVLSGTEAVAWTEGIDPANVVARIDDSLLCLTSDTSAQLSAILSDQTIRATPSTDLTRIYYQYAQESESGHEVCYETRDILVSDADANVTRYNNGSKLVLESETDSLSTCYRTSQGSLYFARLHQGDPNWTTSLLRASGDAPSLDIDYLGRTYVADLATELINGSYKDVIRCQTKAPGSASWTDFLVYQTPYAGTGGFPRVGAPSIVAARNDTGGQNRSAAYIAFSQYQPGVGPQSSSRIIIAKVNTAGVVYVETLHTVTGNFSESLASITAHPVPNQGYGLAVAWQSGSNLNSAIYCQKGGTLDQPQVTTKMSWSRPYNIAYAHRSRHPMLASTQDTIIAAWSEGDSGRILVRGQADDAEYDVWADTVNASLCPDTVCDYPQISVGTGDSTIVIFQKKIAADNYDVIANINLNTQLNLSDNGTNSTYPHCRFDLHQDSIPVVEAIWSEELGPTEDQVAYRHWLLGEQQGQGQQGSEIFDPSIVPMLFAPWPNPSHTQTNIRYQINRQGTVQLNIYDLTGRRITTLVTGTQRPGVYNLQWNRTDDRSRTVSNGIYFLRISAPALTSTRKLVVE